jgi:hypothetical protein
MSDLVKSPSLGHRLALLHFGPSVSKKEEVQFSEWVGIVRQGWPERPPTLE